MIPLPVLVFHAASPVPWKLARIVRKGPFLGIAGGRRDADLPEAVRQEKKTGRRGDRQKPVCWLLKPRVYANIGVLGAVKKK